MMVILGVILLVAAVVTGVAGVVVNSDDAHALTDDFSIFGYAVTGSTGTLFLLGIAVGAVAVLGLALIVTATSRERRRRLAARGELRDVRAEAASVKAERDDLLARVDPGHDTPAIVEAAPVNVEPAPMNAGSGHVNAEADTDVASGAPAHSVDRRS